MRKESDHIHASISGKALWIIQYQISRYNYIQTVGLLIEVLCLHFDSMTTQQNNAIKPALRHSKV